MRINTPTHSIGVEANLSPVAHTISNAAAAITISQAKVIFPHFVLYCQSVADEEDS